MIIHPKDGAMYFAVGGRKTQSALYRVTYTGTESTAPAAPYELTPEIKTRRALEALHLEGTGPEAIEKAWPSLASTDRFVRTAARIAIERQPVEKWRARALAETNPMASIEAFIALARIGRSPAAEAAALAQNSKPGNSNAGLWSTLEVDRGLQAQILESLGKLDFNKLDGQGQLALLRAYELAFTRLGKPAPELCAKVAAKLDPLFPSADPNANRELVGLLVCVDSPSIVAKTVPLLDNTKDEDATIANDAVLARNEGYAKAVEAMHASRPNRQAIAYAYALRNATRRLDSRAAESLLRMVSAHAGMERRKQLPEIHRQHPHRSAGQFRDRCRGAHRSGNQLQSGSAGRACEFRRTERTRAKLHRR